MEAPAVARVPNPRYVILLAGIAVLILVIGALTRPRDEVAPPPSDADVAHLTRLAQRRSLENMSSYFSSVAASVDPSLARVDALQASAVQWDPQRMVSARMRDPLPAQTISTSDGRVAAARVSGRPGLPILAIAASPASAVVPSRRLSTLLRVGEWVVAAWRGPVARNSVPGNVLAVTAGFCGDHTVQLISPTFALNETMAGGGLFDLDNNLLGVVLPCNGHWKVVAVDASTRCSLTLTRRIVPCYRDSV